MNQQDPIDSKLSRTPELESDTIYQVLKRIGSAEHPLLLPAIQRRFVWDSDQICALFDSILRAYPIGEFLFWEIEDSERDRYAFYDFIRDYSEHPEKCYNPAAPRHLPTGVVGVLDGQQRLNSMLVALCGTYWKYIGGQGYHAHRDSSYLCRTLHINIYSQTEENEEEPQANPFAFLTEDEAEPANWGKHAHWFSVGRIFPANSEEELASQWAQHIGEIANPDYSQKDIPLSLRLLRQRIHDEKLIRYFPIRQKQLSEALEIFIRTNNGGKPVTAAAIIFATIIANWPEGKDKIELFQRHLNGTGHRFDLDISRILLGILAVGGFPIRLKIESFNPTTVDGIRADFKRITEHLQKAAELFDKWGLSGNNAVNSNALIALALLLSFQIDIEASEEDLRQFVIRSLLCELYRRPETPLRQIRVYGSEHLAPGLPFLLSHMEEHFILPSGKSLRIGSEYLEELLMVPLWDRRCYILLSLIHHHHALHQHQFHRDHLHPRARFEEMYQYELTPEQQSNWWDSRDRLPNIQLLQGEANNHKRAKPLKVWLENEYPEQASRAVFLDQNDIPLDLDLDFKNFENFFGARKERLRTRLQKALNIKTQEVSSLSMETPV